MKRIIVTLSGVETNNKGAELMLYAILQEIERKYPDSTVYFDVGSVRQGLSYIQTSLKLSPKPIERIEEWYKRLHIPGILYRLHIKENKKLFEDKYAVPSCKFFIDGSGFHFSDEWDWPNWYVERKKKLWENHYKIGAKLIFLPQAFGPFEKESTRRYLSIMAKYAHLIMPREDVSYNYLKNSGVVDMNKVVKFTDFTSLVEGIFPSDYKHLKNGVCVIPNMRMIDHGAISFEVYIQLLTSIIQKAQTSGHPVYLLNHEGISDEQLAYRCKEIIGDSIEVITGLNALEVKGIISSAYLVITSRFHGVASALNSTVPCLATSWSHKYEALFNDYDQHDCILPLDDKDAALTKVDEFLKVETNNRIRAVLQNQVPAIKSQTRKMWETVWEHGQVTVVGETDGQNVQGLL